MPHHSAYKRFHAANLWPSAQEEILFGRGTFTMALDDPAQANVVHQRWIHYLLQHPLGMGFQATTTSNKVHVALSPLGIEAIRAAGYTSGELDTIGMVDSWKAEFFTRFETALKELS